MHGDYQRQSSRPSPPCRWDLSAARSPQATQCVALTAGEHSLEGPGARSVSEPVVFRLTATGEQPKKRSCPRLKELRELVAGGTGGVPDEVPRAIVTGI